MVVHVGPYGSRQCGEVVLVVLLQSCPDAWSRPDAFPMTFSCARLAVEALLLGPAEAEMDCEGLVAVRGADPVRLGRLAKVNLALGIFMV